MTLNKSLQEIKKASSNFSQSVQRMKEVLTTSFIAEYLQLTPRSVNLKIQNDSWSTKDMEKLAKLEKEYKKLTNSIPL